MQVACVLVTHLRLKVEVHRRPHLSASPVVIVDRGSPRTRPLVVDHSWADPDVTDGMTLEQTLSRNARTAVLDADEPYYRRVFSQVLAALQGVSDRVEGDELGTAYVRLDGLERLLQGTMGAASALHHAVPRYLAPRIGVAESKFPAFVAARTCAAHGVFRIPGDGATFLAPHSIDLLPVSTGMKHELHRFGLHTMGAVGSMDGQLFADRFGPEGNRAWALCNGRDSSPVVPLPFEELVIEHTSMPFQSSSIDAVCTAVDALLRRAYARPAMRGRSAAVAELLCLASGWSPWERCVRFKRPVGVWETAAFVIRSRLRADPPRSPIEEVTLTLSGLSGDSGNQLKLLGDVREDRSRGLLEAERRLWALMGGGHALHTIAHVAPWHPAPEMRAFQVPIDPSGRDAIRPLNTPKSVEVRTDTEGQPVAVRTERQWRRVLRIDDWWIFDLWWLPNPVARAYYRIDLANGRRMTLFQDCAGGCWYRQSA